MAIITDRQEALKIKEKFTERKVPMCVFGTGSFWNTEAILLAVQNLKKKSDANENIAVSIAITYDYEHMSQCSRFTYSRDLQAGLEANMHFLDVICGKPGSPYYDVIVLPHLDHAHPERDKWALTEGRGYFASVMFDAQSYTREENMKLTSEYVEKYGKSVLVEGIFDKLAVGHGNKYNDTENENQYIEEITNYVHKTGVDFVVADLGTEQQSEKQGDISYKKERAKALSGRLGNCGIVLHGTSSMNDQQIRELGEDGIAKINMWTRIARETGINAANRLLDRYPSIEKGDFEATESRQYIYDSIVSAAEIMENIMSITGHAGR